MRITKICSILTTLMILHCCAFALLLPIQTTTAQFEDVPLVDVAFDTANVPEPVPPPDVVRNFFELDPFYKQWIDVRGFPVLASAQVNPYAIKEAAWLIGQMIGHRRDVLRAMAANKARFSVIGHTEIITEIPEYRSDPRPDFLVFRERGWGGTEGATVSSSDENILGYPGSYGGTYSVLIHEFAHGIHLLGLNTLDPTFDERLRRTYEAAMKKGLWQGTYASSDRREYWAEATQSWFHPNGPGSFSRFGKTRQALKRYDPKLAALLAEVYGDREWRYTPVATRIHLPHLQGFDPQASPIFEGFPELEAVYRQLRDPNSDGEGAWVNLQSYRPNQLPRLAHSNVHGGWTTVVFVNFSRADVLVYWVQPDGTEGYWTRVPPGYIRGTPSRINEIWLVKDANGRNLAVFQAEEKTGRAGVGASPHKPTRGVRGDSQPQVLVDAFQRPPMYWIDTSAGTLHRLIGDTVENLLPSVQNATNLAVDMDGGKLYWTEKTGNKTGRIRCATLNGTNVRLVKDLTSVPQSIAVDLANDKLYVTNSWGKVQRLNVDGSNFEPSLITELEAPDHIALGVASHKIYWTEGENRIWRANLDGSNPEALVTNLAPIGGIAIADGKLYWTERIGKSEGSIQHANLDGTKIQGLVRLGSIPLGITVDPIGRKLYWTSLKGRIQCVNLDGSNFKTLVVGLGRPAGITLPAREIHRPKVVKISDPAAAPSHIRFAPPEETQVLSNFPNPFNPETWIPYELAMDTDVKITIYNTQGVVVRTLTLGHQSAGYYTGRARAAYWDGRNTVGEQVASGVYFYTFTADEFTATRKMLIRK